MLFGRRIRLVAWWRDLTIAFHTLVGSTVSDRRLLSYLSNRSDLAPSLDELRELMPQASIVDDSIDYRPNTNADEWRMHFALGLKGRGLELGPLNRPLPTHAGMRMTYLDRADQETLNRSYPTLAGAIAPVDIIDDAETVATVADESFDFVVAAHVLEHMRNPIASVAAWLRVLVPGGRLYLIVPDKRLTFDRARVRTTLEHLILDYREPSRVRDFEHFLDFARFTHDEQGQAALDLAHRFEADDESIHFHTFLPKDVLAMVRWMNEHVTPVDIVEGPLMSAEAVEFHLLLGKPARGAPGR
jgi:SAM-dependent methyltransferase